MKTAKSILITPPRSLVSGRVTNNGRRPAFFCRISNGVPCSRRGFVVTADFRNLHKAVTSSALNGTGRKSITTNGAHFQYSTANEQARLKDASLRRVYLAVGSNIGDRFGNIATAISLLCDSDPYSLGFSVTNTDSIPDVENDKSGMHRAETENSTPSHATRLISTSMLHESAPMYVTDQPAFLNGVVEIETRLSPELLLRRIKQVEKNLGRDIGNGIRNGPRPVDLDILFYEKSDNKETGEGRPSPTDPSPNNDLHSSVSTPAKLTPWLILDSPDLVIPHPRMDEREFVLKPLCEVAGIDLFHPIFNKTIGELLNNLQQPQLPTAAPRQTTLAATFQSGMVPVLPLPRGRVISFNQTIIMGVLNVTPDSFSDGGLWNRSHADAVNRALQMEQEGAAIIDIGGESTRPGSKPITVDEEMNRTISIIKRLREATDIPISIDTRRAAVAKAAVEAGADLVNDVSGGRFDPAMLSTVADLRVPIVLMHSRGTPENMQAMTEYNNVVVDIANSLKNTSNTAETAGIHKWLQVLDPGIGFAKDLHGNLRLLKHLAKLREPTLSSAPILLGTSRKGFIGKICGVSNPEDRDFGTVASFVAAICLNDEYRNDSATSGNSKYIVRVHNVEAAKHAALMMDAIRQVD